MRIGRNEIIEELTEHMRNFGGGAGEWCVGTTRDSTLDGKLPVQNSKVLNIATTTKNIPSVVNAK